MTSKPHRLRVISGPAAGRVIEVADPVTIGRQDADLTIGDPDVSRRHATISADGDALLVEDLGSLNGTFVDGQPISAPTRLLANAIVRVGSSEISLELAPGDATRLAPVVRDGDGQRTVLRSAAAVAPPPPPAVPPSATTPPSPTAPPPAAATPPPAAPPQPSAATPPPPATPPPSPATPPPAAGPGQPEQRGGGWGITDENRRWWGLGAVCLALAMALLDTTVVYVALPTIQRALRGSLTNAEWTVNGYTLAFAVSLVTGGRLGDVFGRRRMFVAGLLVFLIGSSCCGFANDMTFLVASRVVQGIGAGFMMPATLSLIRNTFPLPELGRAIGMWASVSAIALAVGPLLGGVLTQGISWRAVFYINIPLGLATLVVTWLAIPESRDEHAERRIDFPGIALLSVAITALVLGIIESDSAGWGSARVLGLLGGAVVALVAFILTEQRVRAPLLPLVVFRNRQFVGATSVGFALSFAMLAILLYTAYYLQGVLGYGAIKAGALLLPATVPIMFAGPVATKLVVRYGFRPTMAGGLLLVAAAAAILTQITASTGYLLLLPAFILLGSGIGLTISPTSGAAISSVPPDKAGAGAGVLNMGRQVGGALGIAITGTIVVSLGRTKARHDLASLALSARARSAIVGNVGTGSAPPPSGHVHLPTSVLAQIEQIVHESFAHGMSIAMFVPVGVALLGAGLALVLVRPPRETQKPALPVLDADIMMVAARSGNWLIVPPEIDSAPTDDQVPAGQVS